MQVSHIFNVFVFSSFLGWIYECSYCTLRSAKWQNRGFLFGPVCPIYGVGCVFSYIFAYCAAAGEPVRSVSAPWIFVICAAGSAVLEYGTSYVLEKHFHARWWDYSHVPFNLNGRVCLPATLSFGAAGLLLIEKIIPWTMTLVQNMNFDPPVWLEEMISLVLMCVLGADIALSASSVTGLLATLEKLEAEFDLKAETAYEPIGKRQILVAEKMVQVKQAAAGRLEGVSEYRTAITDTVKGVAEHGTALVDTVKGVAEHGTALVDNTVRGMTEYRTVLADAVKGMTPYQVRKLMNIVRFTSERTTGTAGKIKQLLLKRNEKEEQTGETNEKSQE